MTYLQRYTFSPIADGKSAAGCSGWTGPGFAVEGQGRNAPPAAGRPRSLSAAAPCRPVPKAHPAARREDGPPRRGRTQPVAMRLRFGRVSWLHLRSGPPQGKDHGEAWQEAACLGRCTLRAAASAPCVFRLQHLACFGSRTLGVDRPHGSAGGGAASKRRIGTVPHRVKLGRWHCVEPWESAWRKAQIRQRVRAVA